MGKYGVELVQLLSPGLGEDSIDEELSIIGHRLGSVGDLLIKLTWVIYTLTYALSTKITESGLVMN
ncbi:MAG: hypothetical protein ACP5NQ_04545 [Vulcanisaeta sp.]